MLNLYPPLFGTNLDQFYWQLLALLAFLNNFSEIEYIKLIGCVLTYET